MKKCFKIVLSKEEVGIAIKEYLERKEQVRIEIVEIDYDGYGFNEKEKFCSFDYEILKPNPSPDAKNK